MTNPADSPRLRADAPIPFHMQAASHTSGVDSRGDASRPVIGITLGDPAGIGPEVIVKSLSDVRLRRQARFVVYGIEELLAYAADLAEIGPFWFKAAHDDSRRVESGVLISDFDDLNYTLPREAKPTLEGGAASMQFLESAIDDLRGGRLDALVTGPISKTSWTLAGIKYPGHTELLGHRFQTHRVTMMFVGGPLKVALASAHDGLFDLRNSFTIGRVFQPIDLLHKALTQWFGVESPRIGVCGLNPHASENGRFGDEEARIIEPAILMARDHGIQLDGPLPADTAFWRAARGEFDGMVAMYHDQGLIPVKLLAFESAVNLTLGLPVIRTSVDHGTAFDIVGKNRANAGSMTAAIELAIQLARRNTALRSSAVMPVNAVDG